MFFSKTKVSIVQQYKFNLINIGIKIFLVGAIFKKIYRIQNNLVKKENITKRLLAQKI